MRAELLGHHRCHTHCQRCAATILLVPLHLCHRRITSCVAGVVVVEVVVEVVVVVVPLRQPRDKNSFQSGYNYCYDFNKSAIMTHTRSSHQPHFVNDENILCLHV